MRLLFLFFGLLTFACQPFPNFSKRDQGKLSVIEESHFKKFVRKSLKVENQNLLPPAQNPAQSYVALCPQAGFTISQELIDVFNNFDSTAYSKRHSNYVHFLDGLTLGMGHWPQAEARYFFGSLNKNEKAKKRFIAEAVAILMTRPEKECRSYLSGRACHKVNLEKLISSTLFNHKFMLEKYGRNCRLNKIYRCASGPNLYYDLPWFKYAVSHALRDKVVTQWQIGFFDRDIISPARNKAKASGLLVRSESTLIFSSFESSFKRYSSELMKVGKNNGFLSFGGKRYHWSKPEGLKNPTAEQLQSWRMLLAFRWYQHIKGSRAKRDSQKSCAYPIRDRQLHLYCKFLKKSWDKYWPDAPLGASSCGKITDRVAKMGGCGRILSRESIVPAKCKP